MTRREPEVMHSREAAAFLGLPYSVLLMHSRSGEIPARKVGKHWLYSRRALIEWLYRYDLDERLSPKGDDR